MKKLHETIEKAADLAFDMHFTAAKEWKSAQPDRVLIGHLPIYFPKEIIHAVNGLAVSIFGTGDRMQIIKGDAYYQSYICHLPRGVIELALNDNLDGFDGFIFPSICDVIRNLSGMFKMLEKGKFVKYMDFPQNFRSEVGGNFYRSEMEHVLSEIKKINGVSLNIERLNEAIVLFNKNRRLINEIYDIRQETPWKLTISDFYQIIRGGMVVPVQQHNEMLEIVCEELQHNIGEPMDKIKVVVSGAFCEQPPVGLLKTIEAAGCYVIDDDFTLGARWLEADVEENTSDPIGALVDAYLKHSTFSSAVYDVGNPKGERLVALARKRKADGIVFAAPSFCDPAMLDRPLMQMVCEREGLRYIDFQYHENIGQFKVIKEQVGAFSDSIKLWDDTLVA